MEEVVTLNGTEYRVGDVIQFQLEQSMFAAVGENRTQGGHLATLQSKGDDITVVSISGEGTAALSNAKSGHAAVVSIDKMTLPEPESPVEASGPSDVFDQPEVELPKSGNTRRKKRK